METALDAKADKTAMETALDAKADKTDLVPINTALNSKAKKLQTKNIFTNFRKM
jgi:ribosomal protein L4